MNGRGCNLSRFHFLSSRLLFGAGSRKLKGRARRESWLLAWDCKSHASQLAGFDSLGAHLRQTHAVNLAEDGSRGRIAAQSLLVLGGLRKQGGIGDCPEANTQNQEAFLFKICKSCAFGREAELQPDSATTHECREDSPRIDPNTGIGVWPRVVSSDWCGKWAAKR